MKTVVFPQAIAEALGYRHVTASPPPPSAYSYPVDNLSQMWITPRNMWIPCG